MIKNIIKLLSNTPPSMAKEQRAETVSQSQEQTSNNFGSLLECK